MIGHLKRFGEMAGDAISSTFLLVFYFTVFATVAIPYRLMQLKRTRSRMSAYTEVGKRLSSRADFEKEF